MRLVVSAGLFLVLAVQAVGSETMVSASRVLSAISGYMDGEYFRAVVVQGDEDADFYIFAGDNWNPEEIIYVKDIVPTGIGGSDAYLERLENGSLQLVSENAAIGRHRWEQRPTIVFREEKFIVGGFTYSYYDTLSTDEEGNVKTGFCDLNLLTGKGERDGDMISVSTSAIAVEDWTIESFPDECLVD